MTLRPPDARREIGDGGEATNAFMTYPVGVDIGPSGYLFFVDSNNLSGTIPDDICNIYIQNSNFDLSGNQFCHPLQNCLDTPNEI